VLARLQPSSRGAILGSLMTTQRPQDPAVGSAARAAGVEPDSERRILTRAEGIFAAAGFPILITLTIGSSIIAIQRGSDPNLVTLVMIFLAYFSIAVSERLMPWHRSWLHSHGDLRTDIGLAITNGILGGILTPILLVATANLGAALSEGVGADLWPLHWPLLGQLALALFVAELVEYSFHRMMHEVPFMWRFHATHHSAPRLYWLNAARFHPVDLFLVGAVKIVPLALLGAQLPIFALVNLFSAVHGAYQHSNVPVRLGPLNWIFSMTELHRWHHSKHIEESNHNYGGNLILWDVIFGTRYLPEDRDPPEEIGMEALPGFPMGFWANMASPFNWSRLVARASDPSSGGKPVQ
jgi:sterol desaturase/sphingolipid hydroxylase (fatty acid hydroxylase superfamily)